MLLGEKLKEGNYGGLGFNKRWAVELQSESPHPSRYALFHLGEGQGEGINGIETI